MLLSVLSYIPNNIIYAARLNSLISIYVQIHDTMGTNINSTIKSSTRSWGLSSHMSPHQHKSDVQQTCAASCLSLFFLSFFYPLITTFYTSEIMDIWRCGFCYINRLTLWTCATTSYINTHFKTTNRLFTCSLSIILDLSILCLQHLYPSYVCRSEST